MGEETTGAYPYPKPLTDGFTDESEYTNWIAETFERFGWTCHKQPCLDSGDSSADIIGINNVWGGVGVLTNYKQKLQPSDWVETLNQLQDPPMEVFRGVLVDKWVVAANQSVDPIDPPCPFDIHESLTSNGLGLLRTQGRLEILFRSNGNRLSIPIADVDDSTGQVQRPERGRLIECLMAMEKMIELNRFQNEQA